MGLYEQFPYANFHELNLQWLLEKLRDLEQRLNNIEVKDYDEIIAEILRRLSTAEENITNNYIDLSQKISSLTNVVNQHYLDLSQKIMIVNNRITTIENQINDLLNRVIMLETKVNVMYFHVVTFEEFETIPHLPNHQYWVTDGLNLELWLGDQQLTFKHAIYRTVLTLILYNRYQMGYNVIAERKVELT